MDTFENSELESAWTSNFDGIAVETLSAKIALHIDLVDLEGKNYHEHVYDYMSSVSIDGFKILKYKEQEGDGYNEAVITVEIWKLS